MNEPDELRRKRDTTQENVNRLFDPADRPVATPQSEWRERLRLENNSTSKAMEVLKKNGYLDPKDFQVPKELLPASQAKRGKKNYRVTYQGWVVEVHLANGAFRLIKDRYGVLLTKDNTPNICWKKCGGISAAWKKLKERVAPK